MLPSMRKPGKKGKSESRTVHGSSKKRRPTKVKGANDLYLCLGCITFVTVQQKTNFIIRLKDTHDTQ